MTTHTNSCPVALDPAGSAVMELTPEMRLHRQAGVVLCHVDGKHMLVPAMTDKVNLDCLFLLNATGAFVWEQLDGRRRVAQIGEALAKAFGIPVDAAVEDASRFLTSLLDQQLVEPPEPHWY
jgi:hypothetical protein